MIMIMMAMMLFMMIMMSKIDENLWSGPDNVANDA